MIERYSRPEMAGLWDSERRLRLMLEVEFALLEVLARSKRVPARELRVLGSLRRLELARAVKRKEAESGHEVVALLEVISDAVARRAPAIHRYLHYGLTSSDVLDTVLALQLREAAGLILEGWRAVSGRIRALARRHERTWMAGRTHGVHAEPISFGAKLAGWHAEALRNIARVERARETISRGKLSGAVGTFSQLGPGIEAGVCGRLGLKPEPVGTQVVPRDRHAEYFNALALSAAAVERWAVEIRHLQRTEVLELEEPFGAGQKGSSAMPHKRNPVLCENLCGLARLVRTYEPAILEDIALWHERDISHSSVERVALPDATILVDFMLDRFASVLKGLRVHPGRMRENLERSRGLVFSQRVLLRLIDAGLGRMEAYALVQRCAMECSRSGRQFLEILARDPEVAEALSRRALEACFELDGYGNSTRAILKRGGVA